MKPEDTWCFLAPSKEWETVKNQGTSTNFFEEPNKEFMARVDINLSLTTASPPSDVNGDGSLIYPTHA